MHGRPNKCMVRPSNSQAFPSVIRRGRMHLFDSRTKHYSILIDHHKIHYSILIIHFKVTYHPQVRRHKF